MGVTVRVDVAVGVGVADRVAVAVKVAVEVKVAVGVVVALGVGVDDCEAGTSKMASAVITRLPDIVAVALYLGDADPAAGAARSPNASVKPSLLEAISAR